MPRSIDLLRVAFAYPSAGELAPVFSDVSLRFTPGWTAIVGPNGSGKSTLAGLLAGDLRPTAGSVVSSPGDLSVARVSQLVEVLDPAVRAFADGASGEAVRWRAELGLTAGDLHRWPTLSPGERKRWQLGAALATGPDVLVLDEPDAHLDEPGRRFVLEALRRFRGIGVLVSHRRDVLEALAKRTVFLEGGAARDYACAFGEARESRERDRIAGQDARRRLRVERDQLSASLHELKARQRGAERQKIAGNRMKSARDSDARSFAGTFAASKASGALARRAQATESRRARVEAQIERVPFTRELGGSIVLRAGSASGSRVATLVTDAVMAGDARVLGHTSLTLGRTDRVRLAGPNGSGKSTLLRRLANSAGSNLVLHLEQSLTDRERRRAVDSVRALGPADRGRALALLAALGSDPDKVVRAELPSPGEARKLLLVRALVAEPVALFLDEPTNDLDLPTTERLERALVAYEGALVLVTHDDSLARATTERTWTIREGLVELA